MYDMFNTFYVACGKVTVRWLERKNPLLPLHGLFFWISSRGIPQPLLHQGARCSSVVRAFAHGAMGHQIDPSLWTH